jgi:hypothetical protein
LFHGYLGAGWNVTVLILGRRRADPGNPFREVDEAPTMQIAHDSQSPHLWGGGGQPQTARSRQDKSAGKPICTNQNPFTVTGKRFILEQYKSKASREIPC